MPLAPKLAVAVREVGQVVGESDAMVGLPYLYLTLTLTAVHACTGSSPGGLVPAIRSMGNVDKA
jgi:hypothetical protein